MKTLDTYFPFQETNQSDTETYSRTSVSFEETKAGQGLEIENKILCQVCEEVDALGLEPG